MIHRLFILLCFSISGCASTSTPEERAWRYQMALENYNLCAEVYRRGGYAMVHRDHLHSERAKVGIHELEQDLAFNRCKSVLGKYWAE